jgi:hypothetical protein
LKKLLASSLGRAFVELPTGALVLDLDQPDQPTATAFLPAGYEDFSLILDGDDVMMQIEDEGLTHFDLDDPRLRVPPVE